ncbi:MAG: hypothetical protein LH603_18810 [Pseudonocardia sp.]|nr:hypothetical protein [Pseudonocardia sp.]
MTDARGRTWAAGLLALAGALLLGGCTPAPPSPAPEPSPATSTSQVPSGQAEPPPPAACLLDAAALAAATGMTWTPDRTTASDTRCVYDPARDPAAATGGADFVAVDVAPSGTDDPAGELDTLAQVCDDGSRAAAGPGDAGVAGFVCRFRSGSVFAAAARGGQVVTVAASAVPSGTTAAQLVVAFTEQLDLLG